MTASHPDRFSRVCAVLLAAGSACRFGSNKLLAQFGSKPLVCHAALAAFESGVGSLVVVLGRDASTVQRSIQRIIGSSRVSIEFVTNDRYLSGQASSLLAGLSRCVGRSDAALICLGDQPLVSANLMRGLIEAYYACDPPAKAVVPTFEGRRGNPVLIDSTLYPETLKSISGDVGARNVLKRHANQTLFVPAGKEVILDVDTVEDLERLPIL